MKNLYINLGLIKIGHYTKVAIYGPKYSTWDYRIDHESGLAIAWSPLGVVLWRLVGVAAIIYVLTASILEGYIPIWLRVGSSLLWANLLWKWCLYLSDAVETFNSKRRI